MTLLKALYYKGLFQIDDESATFINSRFKSTKVYSKLLRQR
jgi:hypothetical protein